MKKKIENYFVLILMGNILHKNKSKAMDILNIYQHTKASHG